MRGSLPSIARRYRGFSLVRTVSFLFLFSTSLFGADEAKTYRIGVLAKRGAEICRSKWTTTADYLGDAIPGADFEIVPLDFEQIYPAVESDAVDFVIANSSFYVNLEARFGCGRIATLKNLRQGKVCTVFGGVVFTKSGSGIQGMRDLKGKRFMAVEHTSFGGWQMAWRELKNCGIDPERYFKPLLFGGTHDAVVYAVQSGEVDAGTVRTDTLERMQSEGKIDIGNFVVLEPCKSHLFPGGEEPDRGDFEFVRSTRLYPEWPMAKTAKTPDAIAEKVTAALLSMPPESLAARDAKCAGWTIPHNYAPVNACLRELRLPPYEDYGKICAHDLFEQFGGWLIGTLILLLVVIAGSVRTRKLNAALTRSIRELQEAEGKLEKRARQQTAVARFGEKALSESSLDSLFESAVQFVSRVLGTRYAEVLEHRTETAELFMCTGSGLKEGRNGANSIPDDPGTPGGYTLLQSKPVISNEMASDNRFTVPGLLTEHGVVSGLTVAIPGKKRPFGVLGAFHDRPMAFTEDDAYFLEAFANLLAAAIQRLCSMRELQKSEARYQEVISSISDIVWSYAVDEEMNLLDNYISPVADRLLGVPEGTIGNSFESYFSYVDPQDLPQVKGKLNSLLTEKDQRAEVEYRVKTAGGETRWLRSAGGKRIDSRGRLVVSGITSDITERKLAEQKLNLAQAHLLQSEKMASIGQLAAGVAHEINNPTGFIMSNLGTLKEYLQTYQKLVGLYEELEKTSASPDTGERERVFSCIKVLREDEDIDFIGEDSVQLLDESLEGTERIRDIVQNLKSFARVDESETKKADLNECLESTLKIVWNELKYKCRVNKKFGDVPAVTCNPGQLNQVFVNLLVNAAHAIPEKGDVTIETYADDRGVYVRIADTGAGIPPEIMSRIFDPFYTTKKQGVGTGLGLSISHGIIEKHGGTIDVASEVGKGTAFTIFLPLANSPADSFGDGNPRIVKDPES